jgi:hypothetical protein
LQGLEQAGSLVAGPIFFFAAMGDPMKPSDRPAVAS